MQRTSLQVRRRTVGKLAAQWFLWFSCVADLFHVESILSFLFIRRLLMDYPFVGQTSATYSDHVTSLTQNQESRKQITANTIRILLLEEQNNELRHTTNKKAKELKDISEPSCPKVWHSVNCA